MHAGTTLCSCAAQLACLLKEKYTMFASNPKSPTTFRGLIHPMPPSNKRVKRYQSTLAMFGVLDPIHQLLHRKGMFEELVFSLAQQLLVPTPRIFDQTARFKMRISSIELVPLHPPCIPVLFAKGFVWRRLVLDTCKQCHMSPSLRPSILFANLAMLSASSPTCCPGSVELLMFWPSS